MIPMTLGDIAAAVGGRLHRATGDEVVSGTVEFDSREVGAGGLFVAVPGERVDGHDYAAEAMAAGAVGVLAARPVDAPAVLVPPVDDAHRRSVALAGDIDGSGAAVLAGLGALAHEVADGLCAGGLTIVGITGSSGKTSTKDLMAQLLEPMGETVAPPGSFNNELGHPWTVLRATAATRYLVLELSARGPGHIAALCRTARPRIGVVLNVGSAHLGEFGSREGIARTKGELVEALPPDGLAVLNADDPIVAAMAARTEARVVLVGRADGADLRATDVELDAEARPGFRIGDSASGQSVQSVQLGLHGAHQVGNALACAAVAVELGASLAEVAQRLSAAGRRSGRRMELRTRADGVTVVNDSYNANPESMSAGLRTLAALAGGRRRSWAVLGVMAELGASGEAAHAEIGRLAVDLGVDRLVVVGEPAAAMLTEVEDKEAVLVPDVDAAVALLRAELRPEDVVLVKASKVAALWRVADALLAGTDGGVA
jgi:UDP-N-acetylmuramoyl-tripeptide--D-alanyl-D-alanine ligase